MKQHYLKNADNEMLARILMGSASRLNGNEQPVMMDGGANDRETVDACLHEIAERCMQSQGTKESEYLKPILEVLKAVENIYDLCKVPDALKNVVLPPPTHREKTKQIPLHPFR